MDILEHPEQIDRMDHGIAPPGFRLSERARIGRIRLQVADLRRSLRYYGDVLGFVTLERSAARAVLGSAEDAVPLIELHESQGAAPVPRRGRLGLFHFAILLPDRGALGAFIRHLGEIGERAGASDHLVSEALYLQDPDGLGIEVYADRPRERWRHRDGQLVMATEPLDIAAVVAAAGGVKWSGMPAGTTIGHIHLHVGDLQQAEAFYHTGLGLDKVVWSYPGALFLSAGGYHHHLGLNTWAAAAEPAGPRDARLMDWDLVLPSAGEVEAAAVSLEEAGWPPSTEGSDRPGSSPVTDTGKGALCRAATDPWGSTVRLVSSA